MLEIYSSNDLILYLYNETGLKDSVFIQKAIDNDVELEEEFNQFVAVKELLENHSCSMPKPSTIDAIMSYSGMHSFLH